MTKMPAWLKRECGGRVGRADGGRAWQGESDTGQHLRDKADLYKARAKDDAKGALKSAPSIIVGEMIKEVASGRPTRALGRAIKGAGMAFTGLDAVSAAANAAKASETRDLSEKAEGRARGGRAQRKGK